MANITMSMEEYQALLYNASQGDPITAVQARHELKFVDPPAPKKRKVSRYNREFGRQLKRLKAKHPKTQSKNLMKRAHALTKKALKS